VGGDGGRIRGGARGDGEGDDEDKQGESLSTRDSETQSLDSPLIALEGEGSLPRVA